MKQTRVPHKQRNPNSPHNVDDLSCLLTGIRYGLLEVYVFAVSRSDLDIFSMQVMGQQQTEGIDFDIR
ncbi:MAG: hypothetical protein ABSH52_16355 [Terriglobia bacterium]|jgi:hypothetical protein